MGAHHYAGVVALMMGRERQSKVTARFYMPAVLNHSHRGADWAYSGIRFVVSDTADKFLVQYVLSTVRS